MAEKDTGGIMSTLGKVGRGVGKGLGVALTPIAMVQAARSGRSPVEAMEGIWGPDMSRQLQQAQLDQIHRQGLAQQIDILTNPQKRAALMGMPDVAGQMGFPVQEVPGGLGGAPQQQVMLPDIPVSPADQLAQARADREAQLSTLLANFLPGAGGAPGGGAGVGGIQPVGGAAPVAQPAASGMGVRGFNVGPGGVSLTVGPDPAIAESQKAERQRIDKGREEVTAQRVRSAGATALLEDLKGSVNRIYSAKSLGELPSQALRLGRLNLEGDEDAVNIATAKGRITVLVEALQKDARVSNQDASFLMENLPSLYTDTHKRALSKIKKIEDLLAKKNINLDEELNRLEAGVTGTSVPGSTTTTTPSAQGGPPSTQAPMPSGVERARARVAALGAAPTARAKGGSLRPNEVGLVGERGPELSISGDPRTIVPLQQMAMDDRTARALQALQAQESAARQAGAMRAPGMSSGGGGFVGANSAPARPLQPIGQVPTGLSVGGGPGLSPEDAARATQGGVVITLDADGNPIVMPR